MGDDYQDFLRSMEAPRIPSPTPLVQDFEIFSSINNLSPIKTFNSHGNSVLASSPINFSREETLSERLHHSSLSGKRNFTREYQDGSSTLGENMVVSISPPLAQFTYSENSFDIDSASQDQSCNSNSMSGPPDFSSMSLCHTGDDSGDCLPPNISIGLHADGSNASFDATSNYSTMYTGVGEQLESQAIQMSEYALGHQYLPDVNPMNCLPSSVYLDGNNQSDVDSSDLAWAENCTQSSYSLKRKNGGTENGGKHCNCKKTNCLKLYCDCFAAGEYCDEACACEGCFNTPEYDDLVSDVREKIETRNPFAFIPKGMTPTTGRHKRGCNCKKSLCLKNYCECFRARIACSAGCRCEGCKNTYVEMTSMNPSLNSGPGSFQSISPFNSASSDTSTDLTGNNLFAKAREENLASFSEDFVSEHLNSSLPWHMDTSHASTVSETTETNILQPNIFGGSNRFSADPIYQNFSPATPLHQIVGVTSMNPRLNSGPGSFQSISSFNLASSDTPTNLTRRNLFAKAREENLASFSEDFVSEHLNRSLPWHLDTSHASTVSETTKTNILQPNIFGGSNRASVDPIYQNFSPATPLHQIGELDQHCGQRNSRETDSPGIPNCRIKPMDASTHQMCDTPVPEGFHRMYQSAPRFRPPTSEDDNSGGNNTI